MNLLIHTIEENDQAFLYMALYYATGFDEDPSRDINAIKSNPDLSKYADAWGRKGDMGKLAVDGDISVGVAWIRLFTSQKPGYGFVREDIPELSIALVPAYRGRGIGKLLLTALLDMTQEHYAAVSLSVQPDNETALALYTKLGFQPVLNPLDDSSIVMLKEFS